ncbi:MAG: FlgD immunoglobulin-like domain containing protein, partial [Candidatus Poribacteria bacterium]
IDSGYASGPDASHTEANQSLFVEEATSAVMDNGGSGFFYSTLYSCDCGGERPTLSENYWGLIGPGGKKPAWSTYHDIINPLAAAPLKLDLKIEPGNLSKQIKLLPSQTALLPNYPNPFNPETWLPYNLAQDANVVINIYDGYGRLIRTLPQGKKSPGMYVAKDRAAYWDGKDNSGQSVASGVYFYTLQAGEFSETRKMLIVK